MASPRTVTQYADDATTQVQWKSDYLNFLTAPNVSSVTTVTPLRHIARAPKYDIIDVTWNIMATNFNFDNVPSSISTVILTIDMNRNGRIADDLIQLCYQGELIGINQCKPVADATGKSLLTPHNVYGGNLDVWQLPDLTSSMIQDPTFGVVLRYKGHPSWPHRIAPILYAVGLQID